MLLAAALNAACCSASLGGSTGTAGSGGMPEKTSGKPNRLNRRRACASSDGGSGSVSSSARTITDPRTWLATGGKGPFTRLSATNQMASSEARTATREPPTASAGPKRVARARSRIR